MANFLTLPTQYRDFLNKKGGPGLSSMDDRLDFIIIELWNLLVLMNVPVTPPPDGGGVPPPPSPSLGYPTNQPTFITGRAVIAAADVAQQLTSGSVLIPNGFSVTIMAAPTNTGYIRIGPTKSDAEGSNAFNGISGGLAVSLYIDDVSDIWVAGTVAGDIASYIVEKS